MSQACFFNRSPFWIRTLLLASSLDYVPRVSVTLHLVSAVTPEVYLENQLEFAMSSNILKDQSQVRSHLSIANLLASPIEDCNRVSELFKFQFHFLTEKVNFVPKSFKDAPHWAPLSHRVGLFECRASGMKLINYK